MCTDDYHAYVMIAQEYMDFTTPHPLKKRSIELGNMPVVMVPSMIYSNDTSGNKSKVCNKFDSWSFLLAGLPKKENAKLENIYFICSSYKVSVLELAVAPVQELELLEDGIVAYDAAMQSDVLIVSPVYVYCATIPELHKYVVILAQARGNSAEFVMYVYTFSVHNIFISFLLTPRPRVK